MKAYKKNQISKTTTDRRQYHIVCCTGWKEWNDDFNSEYRTTNRGCSGFRKKRVIEHFQYRMYRTWKHNRKNQWK